MFAKRLNEMLEKRHMSAADLARIINVSEASISQYRKGLYEPKQRRLDAIAKALHTTPSYLMGMDGEPTDKKKGVKIAVLGKVAAGIPIEAIEDILDYEEITEEMARTGEFFALQIKGDSMSPRILDGDVVIVRKQSYCESGKTAIVMVNGEDATCKRVLQNDNGITLMPLNPTHMPTFYTNEQIESLPVTIIGQVVELRCKM